MEFFGVGVESKRTALSLYIDDEGYGFLEKLPESVFLTAVFLDGMDFLGELVQMLVFPNDLLNYFYLVMCVFPSILSQVYQQSDEFCLQIVIAQRNRLA